MPEEPVYLHGGSAHGSVPQGPGSSPHHGFLRLRPERRARPITHRAQRDGSANHVQVSARPITSACLFSNAHCCSCVLRKRTGHWKHVSSTFLKLREGCLGGGRPGRVQGTLFAERNLCHVTPVTAEWHCGDMCMSSIVTVLLLL